MGNSKLTEQSRAILEAISQGHSYEQILVQDLAWTYHDIFRAAAEALDVAAAARDGGKDYDQRMEEIRQAHPRAYEKWDAEEDERLRRLFHSGTSVKEIAHILQRQPSAIRSRLTKFNLVAPEAATDGERQGVKTLETRDGGVD
ncbi:MAG: hypothetical protein GX621_18000 [Pirellulaceae bacterium]|nr:hypothetical protein [Pirellulaceae bacterium]